MHARVSTFEGTPEQASEGIRLVKEWVVPVARLQDGFKGIYVLLDRENGRSLAVTLWATEEDLRASEEATLRAKTASAESAGETVVGVERYEVVLKELVE